MHVNVLSILMHMKHGSPMFISDASSFLILGLKLRVFKNVYDVRVKIQNTQIVLLLLHVLNLHLVTALRSCSGLGLHAKQPPG